MLFLRRGAQAGEQRERHKTHTRDVAQLLHWIGILSRLLMPATRAFEGCAHSGIMVGRTWREKDN
jgi:hypothetical protein